MRLSGLSFSQSTAVLLLFSCLSVSSLLAQHGGGGGGGSSAGSSGGSSSGGGSFSAASSGGSSHGSGGGGSFSGGGSRSSGGSSSHGSEAGSHNSGTTASLGNGSSQTSSLSRSNNQRIRDITRVALIEPISEPIKAAPPKRGFFSFLAHPFHRQAEEPVAAFQHRVCWRGECRVCPVAQLPRAGGCAIPHIYLRYANQCSRPEIWSGVCWQINAVEDCSGLRAAMERQARRMEAAEAARQNACSSVFTEQCTDLAGQAQSEVSLYGALQQKFNQCMQRSGRSQATGNNLFSPHYFRDFGVDTDRP
jgi:hypothetical protein